MVWFSILLGWSSTSGMMTKQFLFQQCNSFIVFMYKCLKRIPSLPISLYQGLAEKYKKTVAQIILRWGFERITVVIPKTSKLERLQENFKIFDFALSEEDMDLIKSLDRKHRTNNPVNFWGLDLYAWVCFSSVSAHFFTSEQIGSYRLRGVYFYLTFIGVYLYENLGDFLF